MWHHLNNESLGEQIIHEPQSSDFVAVRTPFSWKQSHPATLF